MGNTSEIRVRMQHWVEGPDEECRQQGEPAGGSAIEAVEHEEPKLRMKKLGRKERY